MPASMRKWISLLISVVLYYVVHEGAHLVVALALGAFQSVRFVYWGLGIQIVADTALMSHLQRFVFSAAGAVCSLAAGYCLLAARRRLASSSGLLLRAIAYYATLIFLCLDPFYLSILYRFVGGGDMNGILAMGLPEPAAVAVFLLLLAVNLLLFVKLVYPLYRRRFIDGGGS